MRKLLVVIDDMFWEDDSRMRGFEPVTKEPWKIFMPLLEWKDDFVRNIGGRVISYLMVASEERPTQNDMNYFLHWLKDELDQDNPYMMSVIRCLQKLLRRDDYRMAFMAMSGIFKIVRLLTFKLKAQAQYQLSFCLWVASLNPQLAEKMNRSGTIPVLSEVLQSCPSEVLKIPRIIIAIYRNLLEKPREIGVIKHNALVMLQCKILTYLRNIEHKIEDFSDEEFEEDYKFVTDVLESHLKELSSFDEYKMEVLSRQLEWSIVHKSKKFWVENAERLNENKYELVKILIDLLETSEDNVVLCIAAHDVGEYMKQHSRGKKVVEDLGGKDALIQLLEHRHPTVKYYVLKSLQILMLSNYDLFIKHLRAPEEWSDLDMTVTWKS
nr:V-type proton ATPase subunit H-like [Parasteatoda tepidariorum]